MTHEQFAKQVKAWRARRGLTQKEAAKILHVPLATLQNWEMQRNMPRITGLYYVLQVIGQKRRR